MQELSNRVPTQQHTKRLQRLYGKEASCNQLLLICCWGRACNCIATRNYMLKLAQACDHLHINVVIQLCAGSPLVNRQWSKLPGKFCIEVCGQQGPQHGHLCAFVDPRFTASRDVKQALQEGFCLHERTGTFSAMQQQFCRNRNDDPAKCWFVVGAGSIDCWCAIPPSNWIAPAGTRSLLDTYQLSARQATPNAFPLSHGKYPKALTERSSSGSTAQTCAVLPAWPGHFEDSSEEVSSTAAREQRKSQAGDDTQLICDAILRRNTIAVHAHAPSFTHKALRVAELM